ncbi:MAG TPA: DUF1849 family protein [Kiloniellales bacterium]|nr:DUF1849 family protein [Kiloniellales bacterium]
MREALALALTVLALCLLPLSSAQAAPGVPSELKAAAARIEPHRAAYDLRLDRSLSSPDIASAVGRLEFEWADVCSGWTVQQRSRVLLDRAEGPRIDFGWTLNSWEAKDGTRYRFIIRRFLAGRESAETRGEAELKEPLGAGSARFATPEAFSVTLPEGVAFPTMHSLEIIARAEAEELPFWRVVFDGSGEDGGLAGVSALPVRIFTAGEAGERLLQDPELYELLAKQPAWRVQLAFFAPGEVDSLPLHEQTLTLYRNGVADDLVFDYGDFTLRAELVELEALADSGC